jgi:uncharacterized protein YigE (DUF2233 family)
MRRFTLLLFLLFPFHLGAEWRALETGLDYESRVLDSSRPEFSAHVFRIDPKKFRVGLLVASDFGEKALTAGDFRGRGRAVLAINGGFFEADFRPLGLLFHDGKTLNPIRNSAWGVFTAGDDGAKVIHRKDWDPKGVAAALQVGPRLVVDGVVQKFRENGPDRRSAIGVTPEGKIVIAVVDKPILLSEWAAILAKNCPNALNLDGGSSTQLSATVKEWTLSVEGLTAVPNALAVFHRPSPTK